MNFISNNYLSVEEAFTSYEEFSKYLQETIRHFRDGQKQAKKGLDSFSQLVPNTMEIDYVKDLQSPRLVFPRGSTDTITIQLPASHSKKAENTRHNFQFYASTIKIIELDFLIRISIIRKLFDSKRKPKINQKSK